MTDLFADLKGALLIERKSSSQLSEEIHSVLPQSTDPSRVEERSTCTAEGPSRWEDRKRACDLWADHFYYRQDRKRAGRQRAAPLLLSTSSVTDIRVRDVTNAELVDEGDPFPGLERT
jgi:hypothetical protein